jgi:hypothetical protein
MKIIDSSERVVWIAGQLSRFFRAPKCALVCLPKSTAPHLHDGVAWALGGFFGALSISRQANPCRGLIEGRERERERPGGVQCKRDRALGRALATTLLNDSVADFQIQPLSPSLILPRNLAIREIQCDEYAFFEFGQTCEAAELEFCVPNTVTLFPR